jgi:hypothetical protein
MGAVRVKPFHSRGIGVVALWALAGCGAAPLLPAEVGQADEVIHAAEAAGARDDMSAWLYLDHAGQELRLAQAQASERDVEGARFWAIRAWADAHLAWVVTREIKARAAAQRGWDEVNRIEDAIEEIEGGRRPEDGAEAARRHYGRDREAAPLPSPEGASRDNAYVAMRMAERARIEGLLDTHQEACARAHEKVALLRETLARLRAGLPERP